MSKRTIPTKMHPLLVPFHPSNASLPDAYSKQAEVAKIICEQLEAMTLDSAMLYQVAIHIGAPLVPHLEDIVNQAYAGEACAYPVELRCNALDVLGVMVDLAYSAMPTVLKALQDEDTLVQEYAVITLMRFDAHPQAVPALVNLLVNGGETIRGKFREHLGRFITKGIVIAKGKRSPPTQENKEALEALTTVVSTLLRFHHRPEKQ